MPTGPLRTYFRQDAGFPQDEPDMTDSLLNSMIKASRGPGMPRIPTSTSPSRTTYPMPGAPKPPAPMPQMPGQGWGDVLSQVLAGAGDVFSAGGGRPTNYLGQTMNLQQGLRAQAYQQALAQRASIEHAQQMAKEYEFRRYNAEQSATDRDFNRSLQQRQLDLYDKMLGKKEEDEKRRTLEAQINNYKNILGRVEGMKELKLEAQKLRALNPSDSAAIDAVESSLASVFRIESEQPSILAQQLEATIGSKAGGAVKRELKAMYEPQGDKGLPVFNAPRSYRLMYGTGVGAIPAGAMDLAEYYGLADFSGGPQGVGKGLHLTPPTEAEAEAEWRRIVQREMWKKNPPVAPWAQTTPYPWWTPEPRR